jgi:XRE family transcriptional regulator, regulator of sulfur utilization
VLSLRPFVACAVVIGGTLALVLVARSPALGQGDAALMDSAVFAWESLPPTPTKVGAVRRVVRAPTATLDELESHITTLDPGQSPHPPHTHPNEELIIVKEGAVEAFVEGRWVLASTGSMIFFASNHPHTVRNVGTTPATYHVVNWRSAKTPEKPR